MTRYVIRNYGLTRQIPYKGQQIFIANDQAIETDDEELVTVLRAQENLHVTDRGSELASTLSEKPESTEESEEMAYADLHVKDLLVLAKDRQLKTTGLNKAKLIEALEEYDKQEVLEEVPA
jgi:hypothetical protein